MKRLGTIFLLGAFLASGNVMSQDLDNILKEHAEVMGFEKLAGMKTMIITGKTKRGDRENPFTIYIKGKKSRYETDFMGNKMVRAFDGETGWMINPRDGSIRVLEGRQLNQMSQSTQLGGILFNWKEKGFQLAYEGKENFEGTEVYKLKVTNPNGVITYAFLDCESYVLLKQISIREFQGNRMESTTLFSNYQMIDGVAVAFNSQSASSGDGGQGRGRGMGGGTQVIEKVEFNKPIDDNLFEKPGN
jgi:hypothetical protein